MEPEIQHELEVRLTNAINENISVQMTALQSQIQEMSTSIEQMNQNQPPEPEQPQANAIVENMSAEMTVLQSQKQSFLKLVKMGAQT